VKCSQVTVSIGFSISQETVTPSAYPVQYLLELCQISYLGKQNGDKLFQEFLRAAHHTEGRDVPIQEQQEL